jgi:hypothetical protein
MFFESRKHTRKEGSEGREEGTYNRLDVEFPILGWRLRILSDNALALIQGDA